MKRHSSEQKFQERPNCGKQMQRGNFLQKEKTKYEKILEQYFSSSKKKVSASNCVNNNPSNVIANERERNSPRKRCYSQREFKNYSEIQHQGSSNSL